MNEKSLNEAMTLLNELIDFIDHLISRIEQKATGYELAFEIESYEPKYLEKMHSILDKSHSSSLDKKSFAAIGSLVDIKTDMKEYAHEAVSDNRFKEAYYSILDTLKRIRKKALQEIGYLEFKKHIHESENLFKSQDVGSFINFLDEKYREWEKMKSEKR